MKVIVTILAIDFVYRLIRYGSYEFASIVKWIKSIRSR